MAESEGKSDYENTSDVDYLKHRRKYTRSELTKIKNKISSETKSQSQKSATLARVRNIKEKLDKFNSQISLLLYKSEVTEETFQSEYDSCVFYDGIVDTCLEIIKPEALPSVDNSANANRTALKLPNLPLPTFTSRGEDLNKFFVNFENIIDKYNLTSYEQYIYLQRQLSNEPLTIIKSLEIDCQNYEDAKDLIQKAFANTTTLQYQAIKKLSEIKLNKCDDVYDYIGKIRLLIQSFRNLKIDVNTILQYFLWFGMNEDLQRHFIHITNCNKPDLAQIDEHMFEAAERYMSHCKKTKNLKQSTADNDKSFDDSTLAAAASVTSNKYPDNRKGKFCSLCSTGKQFDHSHAIFNCKNYSSPEEKLDRIKSLNGCCKCGFTNHTTKSCKFKFKRKCACGSYHFDFLCPAESNNKPSNKTKQKREEFKVKSVGNEETVQSGSDYVGVVSAKQCGEDCIVPTFSVKFSNGYRLRAMRDGGCQPNFITEKCAKELNLKIVSDEFLLNVNSFNDKQKLKVKIVEIKISSNHEPIRAICVPSININMNLPGLKGIAQAFVDKGYQLADSFLLQTDKISNLDLILGNLDSQLLPQKDILFGSDTKSVYAKSPKGILLMGSINRMKKNIEYLSVEENLSVQTVSVDETATH